MVGVPRHVLFDPNFEELDTFLIQHPGLFRAEHNADSMPALTAFAEGDGFGPQYFLAPTSGVASNGLPIYDWDQAAAQITRDHVSWSAAQGSPVTVTYAFRATAPRDMPNDTSDFARFDQAQIDQTLLALQMWSDVANITFVRVGTGDTGDGAYSDNASILFGGYLTGPSDIAAFAYYPSPSGGAANNIAGDVWVDVSLNYNATPVEGEYGAQVLEHELGHAIGLSHPGDYNGGTPTYPDNATYFQDSRMYTVMSYFGSAGPGGSLPEFSSGPQLHDIAAAQLLYGANMTTRTGNTVYGFNNNTGLVHFGVSAAGAVFSIWDAGGNDTLDLSGFSTNSEIDLRPESFSSAGPGNTGTDAIGNISIARGVIIENAIGGSGNDTIIGNDANNNLAGNDGSDALNGGDGADTMTGGLGGDTLLGGNGDDMLIGGAGADVLGGGAGADTADYSSSGAAVTVNLQTGVGSGGDAQGDAYASIENITGSAFDDVLTGKNGFANVLDGSDGNDLIAGGQGADTLIGGNSTDTLDYSNSFNGVDIRLFQNTAAGGDANGDSISGFENIIGSTKTDTLAGDDGVNVISGGAGNETITGRDGGDHLNGDDGNDTLLGGNGDDVLIGGAGNDTLGGGVGNDTADYSASGAAINVSLQTGAGSGGDAQGDTLVSIENMIGSAFADIIAGKNNWDNVLDGGAGSDTLSGGTGNDTFVFHANDANGDTVLDFSHTGAGNHDTLEFDGYGLAVDGATFVQIDATHWQINSADGSIHDTITIANAVALTSGDYIFGGG